MKTPAVILLAGLATCHLSADPSMREKITVALVESDQHQPPPKTAKQMVKLKDDTPDVEATVQLPDFEVIAPRNVVPKQQQVELQLAKNEVARRQEEANIHATALDHVFGMSRITLAKERLALLEMQEKILLTSLATSEEDRKELLRLLAKDRYPTSH